MVNKLNFINLDKLPDEYKLLRLFKKNVKIYIPQIKHFINNFNIGKTNNIINEYILTKKLIILKDNVKNINTRNYKKIIGNINFVDEFFIKPSEDPFLWYPKKNSL